MTPQPELFSAKSSSSLCLPVPCRAFFSPSTFTRFHRPFSARCRTDLHRPKHADPRVRSNLQCYGALSIAVCAESSATCSFEVLKSCNNRQTLFPRWETPDPVYWSLGTLGRTKSSRPHSHNSQLTPPPVSLHLKGGTPVILLRLVLVVVLSIT